MFYKIEVYVVTNFSTNLKNTKQLKFCIWSILYAFSKILHFSSFPNFRNSSVAHAKIVKGTLFYLNTVGKIVKGTLFYLNTVGKTQ